MATRLDRLVLLLDTGSTAAVRQTAAQQLGEIQKQHPTELYNLLSRVIVHLRSKSWETRVAAGQAIEAIAANVPDWNPPEEMKTEDSNSPPPTDISDANKLTFATFDLSSVLVHGKLLLGSAGKEYDIDMSDMTPQERLALQRKNLKERLGLGSQFMDVDLLDDVDVSSDAIKDTKTSKSPQTALVPKTAPETPSPAPTPAVAQINMAGLSARERNMLKRKMKQDAKNKSKDKVRMLDLKSQRPSDSSEGKSFATPSPVKVENDKNLDNYDITPQPQSDKIVVESKVPPVDTLVPEVPRNEWPFETVCEHLCMDLFDPSWEIRHGAGIGLRSVLKSQGSGAAKAVGLTIQANEAAHNQWLEDVAIRLLCLFILDRFADFVSDQVVCPVRETCSQTLGVLLQYMTPDSVKQVHGVLLKLIKQDDSAFNQKSIWEIRHAGLLGLKYAVAVRKDLVDMLMDGTTDAVIMGLCDHDDDVRAVSASTLLPVTAEFVRLSSKERIRKLVDTLWDCLTDLKDDLTASTGAVMDLIAKLFEQQTVMDIVREGHSLGTLVPRLYPFFRHIITNVRVAVLNTLITLLDCKTGNEWVEENVYRLVFQNLIVEERDDVLARTIKAWDVLTSITHVDHEVILRGTQNWMGSWFEITMTPVGQQLDVATHFYKPPGAFGSGGGAQTTDTKASNGKTKAKGTSADDDKGGYNLDAGMILQDFSLVTPEKVMRGRVASATALGKIMSIWPDETMEMSYYEVLIALLSSSWASKRQLAAIVIEEWAKAVMKSRFSVKYHGDSEQIIVLADSISFANRLSKVTVSSLENDGIMQVLPEQQQQQPGLPQGYFYELVFVLKRIRSECQSLLNAFVMEGKVTAGKVPSLPALVVGEVAVGPDSADDLFSVETAGWVADACFNTLVSQIGKVRGKQAITASLEDRRKRIVTSIGFYDETKQKADTNILATLAGAVVALGVLPAKLNPVIRSVMNSIKFEQNHEFQRRSASTLASLLALCSKGQGRVNPNDKIVKNLCTFLCSDSLLTPVFADNQQLNGIQSLQKADAPVTTKTTRDNGASSTQLSEPELMRRGAETALKELCDRFKEHLFQSISKLWECMAGKLQTIYADDGSLSSGDPNAADDIIAADPNVGQEIIDALTVIRTVLPVLHENLWKMVISIAPFIAKTLQSRFSLIRFAGARCLATVCDVITIEGMRIVVEKVVPVLGDTRNDAYRQGAAEVIYHLVQLLDAKILPYVIFLIVPILGRMSDPDESVRLVCTNCFALLIKLVPLEAGIPDPPGMSEQLLTHRDEERKFLSQLMDPSKIESFNIPVKINAELRKYQQEGVSWLAFLNKFHLHGILCDDMGLGKTLQSICILASDHENRSVAYVQGKESGPCPPSLVICPPTLSGHWYHEIKNYTDSIKPLMYTGGPPERKRLRGKIKDHDVIIMSYDIIRNDIEDLAKMPWNYCILDEGHIIKNGKTKITRAIKSIRADHRLILSGTPIQNNVLELWSLFDFLMPGFLGTEKIFNDRFGKPILASRDSKSSSKDQEAGALALEALHKQVLPFLLRRLKEDVLHDLPPKIIQDYYCELSDLQKTLYEEFSKSQAKDAVEHELESDADEKEGGSKAQHIFQALQYLRKLCNHPLLVVNPKHPEYTKVMQRLEKSQTSLHDIQNAPKLLALKQLLVDCGIGVTTNEAETDPAAMAAGAVSQHRALIFCQLKTMLDIIENDILKKLMPSVTYLRLDGSIDATKRHDIVQKFNADPSIDLLLLTTHVGGLGLNLTGADTVIFVEHDWNPMKDLQAMDRAHRIGQKKVVNVYRLITRGTLEEKIMGLQKFKLNIANTIVNQQNSGLQSMDTDQILDLFSVPSNAGEERSRKKKDAEGEIAKRVGPKAVLDNLETLWDEKEYEEEYNIDNFISNLK